MLVVVKLFDLSIFEDNDEFIEELDVADESDDSFIGIFCFSMIFCWIFGALVALKRLTGGVFDIVEAVRHLSLRLSTVLATAVVEGVVQVVLPVAATVEVSCMFICWFVESWTSLSIASLLAVVFPCAFVFCKWARFVIFKGVFGEIKSPWLDNTSILRYNCSLCCLISSCWVFICSCILSRASFFSFNSCSCCSFWRIQEVFSSCNLSCKFLNSSSWSLWVYEARGLSR